MAKRSSTQIIENLGGIKQVNRSFGNITKNLSGGALDSQNVEAANALENLALGVPESINGPKFDVIKGIFQKYIDSDSLANAYTLLTLDAMKKFEANFDDLFVKYEGELTFSELGVALLNNYRPSTSQIGVTTKLKTNKFVARHIIQ